MIDERWDDASAELGSALRDLLSKACGTDVVRAVEAEPGGTHAAELRASLTNFGLDDLPAEPVLLAAAAHELGRALAPTAFTATAPVRVVLGESDVGLAARGWVPAAATRALVSTTDEAYFAAVGEPVATAAGDRWRPALARLGAADLGHVDRVVRLHALLDSARLAGAMERLLEHGVQFARDREQFGRPIGSFQAVAHKLADASIAVDGLSLLVRKSAWVAQPAQGGDGAPPWTLVLALTSVASPRALLVAQTVHQVMGGHGYTTEADIQLYSRRLRTWALSGAITVADARCELARRLLAGTSEHLWGSRAGLSLPRWARELDHIAAPGRPQPPGSAALTGRSDS